MDNLFAGDVIFTALASSKEIAIKMVDSKVMAKGAAMGGIDPGNSEGEYTEGMAVDSGMPAVKDPLLSSWPFVIGISSAVLLVSVVLGILLAKRKIKKGIEIYED